MTENRKSISRCDSYEKLSLLAKAAPDLSEENVLTEERIRSYMLKGEIFDLLYSCQRVNDDIIDALQAMADECGLVAQFAEMRAGAVLNRIEGFPSESRQVLHTACRDLFTEKPSCPEATEQARRELAKLNDFLDDLGNGRLCNGYGMPFDTLIHVGIGGSDLGPRAVYEALCAYAKPERKVFFISNVDPDDAAAVLAGVDLSATLALVVSKSGTTQETLSNEQLVRKAFADAGIDPDKRCLAVTGEGSPMDLPHRYLRCFYMYDYIGGRYSTCSMVGAVTLAFALGRAQLNEFLYGASRMDRSAGERDIRKNMPLLMAMLGIWNHNFLGMGTLAVLPYSQALHRFPAHLQQCDMESNGKSVQRNGEPVTMQSGPVVWGEPGTNGQHAFYQLLHQGTEKVAVEFIGFRNSQRGVDSEIQKTTSQQKLLANLLAQSMAMAVGRDNDNPNKNFPGNRVNTVLIGDRLTPECMGALLALYEAKIVFQGFAWNINSFDQEGVQLGKTLASDFLAELKAEGGTGGLVKAFLDTAEIA